MDVDAIRHLEQMLFLLHQVVHGFGMAFQCLLAHNSCLQTHRNLCLFSNGQHRVGKKKEQLCQERSGGKVFGLVQALPSRLSGKDCLSAAPISLSGFMCVQTVYILNVVQ